jgi:hypothetical protein
MPWRHGVRLPPRLPNCPVSTWTRPLGLTRMSYFRETDSCSRRLLGLRRTRRWYEVPDLGRTSGEVCQLEVGLVPDGAPVVRICLVHGSMRVHAGRRWQGSRGNLCPVACVDVDVFAGEVAGPNACGTWARVQIYNDRDVFREHLLVSDVFIEGMFASAAAYLDAG